MPPPGLLGRSRYPKNLGVLDWPEGRQGEPRFHVVIPRNVELPFDMSRGFAVSGGPAIRRLEIHVAEQEDHYDKTTYDELTTLTLNDLPPAPGRTRGRRRR